MTYEKMTSGLANTHSRLKLPILALAFICASSLQATILVQYDMENASNRDATSTEVSGLSASDLTLNNLNASGITTPSGSSDVFRTIISAYAGGTTAGEALTEGAGATGTYFYLTITPDALKSISLTSISFDTFAATGGPSTRQVYLFSDKTGITDGDELISASTVSGSPLIPYNSTATGQNFSLDLSGISAFQNISDSVNFRFYTQTPTASQGIAFDDITIEGSVNTIPEPSSYALFCLTGMAFLLFRSRRQIK
ncbi:PEP-CTERM sorting domain-containing protein [Kiritimatiellota bacterium B12222]|nr:PEP-CTERM sorting domain-containing protein [Kiritimatiellota bacterium B12222]